MAKRQPVFLIIILLLVIIAGAGFWFLRLKFAAPAGSRSSAAIESVPGNLPLRQIRRQSQEGGNGEVIIGRLQSAAQIDGFSCAAGWVHFFESGRLRAFVLNDSATIQGNSIPGGTWVRLNPDSTLALCSFPADTAIQGYPCKGGPGGSEGVTTAFYPTGRLSSFYPRADVMVEGLLCRATPFGPVSLYESGSLKECTLARDALIGGRSVPSGQVVALDAQGQIRSVTAPSWLERVRNWTRIF